MKVYFFSEENDYVFKEKKNFKNVVKLIGEKEKKEFQNINIILCSDNYLLNINRKYLKRNYLTDIITFPNTAENISGDIFISIDRIKENAVIFKVPFINELKRVLIHGILHLCGYEDYNDDQKSNMTKKEDYYLNFF